MVSLAPLAPTIFRPFPQDSHSSAYGLAVRLTSRVWFYPRSLVILPGTRMDHKIHNRTRFKSLLRGEKERALVYQKLVREETMEWAHPAFKDCLVRAPVDRVGLEDPG